MFFPIQTSVIIVTAIGLFAHCSSWSSGYEESLTGVKPPPSSMSFPGRGGGPVQGSASRAASGATDVVEREEEAPQSRDNFTTLNPQGELERLGAQQLSLRESGHQKRLKNELWNNKEEFVTCQQGCVYKKGKEWASLFAVWIVKLVTGIDSITDDDDRKLAIRDNIGEFCLKKESEDNCYKRYKEIHAHTLNQLADSMNKMSEQASTLVTEGEHQRQVIREDPLVKKSKKRQAQKTMFAQFQQMMRDHDDEVKIKKSHNALQVTSSQQYLDWYQEVRKYKPQRDEFCLFTTKKIPVGEETIEVTRRVMTHDGGTQCKIDEVAYKKALDSYTQSQALLRRETEYKDLQEEIAQSGGQYGERKAKALEEQRKRYTAQDPSRSPSHGPGNTVIEDPNLSYEAYNFARGMLLDPTRKTQTTTPDEAGQTQQLGQATPGTPKPTGPLKSKYAEDADPGRAYRQAQQGQRRQNRFTGASQRDLRQIAGEWLDESNPLASTPSPTTGGTPPASGSPSTTPTSGVKTD